MTRTTRAGRLAAILAVAAAAIAGCGSQAGEATLVATAAPTTTEGREAPPSSVPDPTPATSPDEPVPDPQTAYPSTPEGLQAAEARLGGKILADLGPGWTTETFEVGDTGPSDLPKAIRDGGASPAAERQLRDEGFVAGYQQLFTSRQGAAVVVFVYELGDEAQAKVHTDASATEAENATGAPAEELPSVPGSKVIVLPNDQGSSVVAFATKGPYSVQVYGEGPEDMAPVVDDAMTAQLAGL